MSVAWKNHFLQHAENCVNTRVFSRLFLLARTERIVNTEVFGLPRRKKQWHLQCFLLREILKNVTNSLFDYFRLLRDWEKKLQGQQQQQQQQHRNLWCFFTTCQIKLFPAGPQPRAPDQSSAARRTSTTKNFRRYQKTCQKKYHFTYTSHVSSRPASSTHWTRALGAKKN